MKNLVHNKYEIITAITNNIYKSLITQIEDISKENSSRKEKQEAQIKNLCSQRSDMLQQMQVAYNSNQELPGNIKLQLLSINIPEYDIDFYKYNLFQEENSIVVDKIRSSFGVIEKISQAPNPEIDMVKAKAEEAKVIKAVEPPNQKEKEDERKGDRPDRGNRGDFGRGRGAIRGRGEHREDGIKQPRQAKNDGPGWYVENRFKKWEKLPGWFELQIKNATDKGENTFEIYEKGQFVYLVKLNELRSYRVKRNKPTDKSSKIKYEAE